MERRILLIKPNICAVAALPVISGIIVNFAKTVITEVPLNWDRDACHARAMVIRVNRKLESASNVKITPKAGGVNGAKKGSSATQAPVNVKHVSALISVL